MGRVRACRQSVVRPLSDGESARPHHAAHIGLEGCRGVEDPEVLTAARLAGH